MPLIKTGAREYFKRLVGTRLRPATSTSTFSVLRFQFPSYARPVSHWQKITLVGVGLLGGSIGLAVKRRQLADHVAGYVRRVPSVTECRQAGVVDSADTDLVRAVTGADLVILCTPIAQMAELTQRMLRFRHENRWLHAGPGSTQFDIVQPLS